MLNRYDQLSINHLKEEFRRRIVVINLGFVTLFPKIDIILKLLLVNDSRDSQEV